MVIFHVFRFKLKPDALEKIDVIFKTHFDMSFKKKNGVVRELTDAKFIIKNRNSFEFRVIYNQAS